MNLDQFQSLLHSLQSSNNEERANAEGIYSNLLNSNGMVIVEYIIQILQMNSLNNNLFLYCLLLLKNIFARFPAIFLSNQNYDQKIQSFLLNFIDNPSTLQLIQLNVSSLIIAAAKTYFQNQRWPSYQSDIIQRCSSQNICSLSIALDCLILSIHSGFINTQIIAQFIDQWYQMIWPSEPKYTHLLIIRLIFIAAKNNSACQCFSDFVVRFPTFIFNLPYQFANTVLSDLTNYTDIIFNFFGSNFNQLLECFIKIFTNTERNKGERELVLEILVEIAESKPKEMYGFAEIIFSSLISVICEISGPDFINEDYEDPTPRTAAENSIKRLSLCFMKENSNEFSVFLFNVFNHFNEMTNSPEKFRASYVLMRETMELLVSFIKNNGEANELLVRKIINGIGFPNEFCQFASLQVLSEAARNLCPEFQNNFNSILIHPLLMYIQSHLNVSQFAFEALSYVISGSDDQDISSYLNELFQAMISFFNQVPIPSKVFDLQCISSLIEKTGEGIENANNYYQIIVQFLVTVIQTNNLTLTLPAIKAFSMIGFNNNSEQFITDAKRFIDLTMTIKRDNFTDDQNDTLNSAIAAFVANLGSHYPEDFSRMMISFIENANQQVTPQQLPLSSDRSVIIDEILIPNEAENTLYVYSSAQINEIYRSLVMLNSFLLEIGNFILPYYQKLIETFMKSISYFFSDYIQSETILCLEALIVALAENNVNNFNLFALVIESFNQVILNHFQEFEIIPQFLNFASTLITFIPSFESVEPRFLESLLVLSSKSIERCKVEDEDSQFSVFSESAKLLRFIMKCPQVNQNISEKLQWLSQNVFPLSIQAPSFLVPGIATFWASLVGNILRDQNMFNEVFQFICQELNVLDNEAKEVVLMALPDMIKSTLFNENHAGAIVSNLSEFLSTIEDDVELKDSIDAAIYVLTCLFKKYPALLNNQNVLILWLNSLPLKGKKNSPCFRSVYDFLFLLISKNHPIVIQNLPQILKIIAKAVKGTNSSDEAKVGFRAFIQSLLANQQLKALFDTSFNQLNNKNQERILDLMKQETQNAS